MDTKKCFLVELKTAAWFKAHISAPTQGSLPLYAIIGHKSKSKYQAGTFFLQKTLMKAKSI